MSFILSGGGLDKVLSLLSNKVDKISGKGLSTNDYTNTDKNIVDGVTSALADKVSTSSVGSANGVAELDTNGRIPSSQLPSNCVKQGGPGIDLGSNGVYVYTESGDINFRTVSNGIFEYTSVRTILSNIAFDEWLPNNGFDPLTKCNGFFCFSVNNNLKILQGVPNNYSAYATIFGCSGVNYKLLMYVDILGHFAVWSIYDNKWITYSSV